MKRTLYQDDAILVIEWDSYFELFICEEVTNGVTRIICDERDEAASFDDLVYMVNAYAQNNWNIQKLELDFARSITRIRSRV